MLSEDAEIIQRIAPRGLLRALIIAPTREFALQVGVDNMCILVHAVKRQPQELPLEGRISNALGEVGPSITLASLSEVLAFAVGSFIPMPAVRVFSMFAALAVLVDFLLQVTAFVALIVFDFLRTEDYRVDCVPCIRVSSIADSNHGICERKPGFLARYMKGRYEIMRNYMPKVGSLGLDMMFRTCTVQVNLDFSSEADMIRKFRAGLALQPALSGVGETLQQRASILDNTALNTALSSQFLIRIGVFTAVPIILGFILEQGFFRAMDRFRGNGNGILIATDVAARGLDIPGVRTVIHYQLPHSAEVYVHRSGRTARASRDGCSVALISPNDRSKFASLCKSFSKESLRHFPVDSSYMPEALKRLSFSNES